MDISFVILTWNSANYVEKCLESVFSGLEESGLSGEVLVVDNGSSDNTPDILRQHQAARPGIVKPTFLNGNRGTTISRNLALRQAGGDYLCIMDSDVEIRGDAFGTLLAKLKSDPAVGMVVPRILYPSGNWQKSIDRFPTLFHKLNRFFRLRAMEANEGLREKEAAESRTVDYAISAFWLFKREILTNIGFLDERFFYAPEDVDYCLRLWQGGYQIVYEPKAQIVHHTQEISRGLKLNKAKFEHVKGLFHLYRKHGFFFKSPVFKTVS
jgi:GT2 family glycosyltransferase